MAEPRFELLSRAGCHLCDQMAELLDQRLPLYGEAYAVRDVDSRSEWQERYGDVVPVLLRDGVAVAKIRIDSRQLDRVVRQRRSAFGSRDPFKNP